MAREWLELTKLVGQAPIEVERVRLVESGVAIEGPFTLPPLASFSLQEAWQSLLHGGFAQIPLTVTNATIATAALIKSYWPERPVSERQLSLNQGLMNLIAPFFGGMPMCHGAGGLAGQYYFGARTGGTNLIEGSFEVILGLFFAASVAGLFAAFPHPIIGAMMLLVGIEMVRFARLAQPERDYLPMGATIVVALLSNMALGFLAGLGVEALQQYITRQRGDV